MTQLTQTRPTTLQATLPTVAAGPEDFRPQIASAVAAHSAHSALVARLAQRLEQARYEARSLVAKTG